MAERVMKIANTHNNVILSGIVTEGEHYTAVGNQVKCNRRSLYVSFRSVRIGSALVERPTDPEAIRN